MSGGSLVGASPLPWRHHHHLLQSPSPFRLNTFSPLEAAPPLFISARRKAMMPPGHIRAGGNSSPTFLTLEEAGIIELSNLDMHERFLCRLTVSSLNLLRVIAEQEGVSIEELNAGKVCDWFVKDKAKREGDPESATLNWPNEPDW